MAFEQKRNAERLPLDEPLDATANGQPVKILELSAIGCKIQHREKFAMGSTAALKFTFEDRNVDLRAKVARTQLCAGMLYESGLKFADSLEEAPEVMRAIVASLAFEELPVELEPVEPVNAIAAPAEIEDPFIECRLENGVWSKRRIAAPMQPPEGFITVPQDDGELDMLCKTYEYADPDTRRMIRISLELAATKKTD